MTAGVEENFFHQQNWREHKERNLDEKIKSFEALSKPGNPFRLLAEEQIALIELELGNTDNAIEKISQILLDSELTVGLRNRATQMMMALGKDPELIKN